MLVAVVQLSGVKIGIVHRRFRYRFVIWLFCIMFACDPLQRVYERLFSAVFILKCNGASGKGGINFFFSFVYCRYMYGARASV